MSSRRQSRGHPQHHTSGRPPPSSSSNETYTILASLRDKLQSTKITDRRSASKEILEKLQDSNTLRKLEREADLQYDINVSRYAGRGGGSDKNTNNNNEPQVPLPWDRVCVLYRSIMDAALLVSRTLVEGKSESSTTKKRNHANQTGFTKKSTKYTGDDVLFPYKIFLKMDLDQVFDVNDGGYYGSSNISWEEDWKTKPRYGHHLNIHSLVSSSSSVSSSVQKRNQHNDHKNTNGGRYNATYYIPHEYTDRNRGTRLSSKEINGCVNYILNCLNDDDCCSHPGVESSLLHWLVHICSRPEYICNIPPSAELSHVLHELSTRLNRAFVEGHVEERGILPSHKINKHSAISQECLLAVSKCLSSIVYNCTTRLGMGMHLYIRPIIECVGVWAENAWQLQSEGEFASTSHPATEILMHPKSIVSKARNPHSMMVKEGQITATPVRRKLRTEADILALLPYLYSAVTHLLAAHPEQSIPILSDYGHVLLRLARKNYARPTTNLQTRDALTEYVSAHLLVAETSGKLCGLPDGDLGPLVPRIENDDSSNDQEEEERKQEEGDDSTDIGSPNKRAKDKKRKKGKGATLDAKAIGKLLEMIRNEKVWETLFSSAASGQDAKKKKTRRSLSGRKHGRSGGGGGISLPEGGATWTPLTRRQRRHLELMARLIRISQRLHISQAEDRGNGTMDSLESLIENAEEMMQSSGIEQGEIDIQPRDESSPRQQLSTLSEMDSRHVASPSALACSPWIRMVCRHLYKLNPKLGNLISSSSAAAAGDGTLSQGTIRFTAASTQFTQTLQSSESNDMLTGNTDEGTSRERILLESCPILQALTVDEKTIFEEMLGDSAEASTQPGTLTASLTAPTPTMTNSNAELLDTIRPTTTATLQFLCACAEAFPRGECWSSSTRQNWSTILDEGSYPAKTLATILERHGSSPADAAAVVYLLGTTLECHGGSGGDGEIQLWTLVTLLKMTESSAIICSREGLSDAASFGSSSSLTALRTAWQSVWKVLFRYDLRYSSYTSGAFGNNVGELVVQLLTQIVRYQCVDRKCLFTCRPPFTVQSSTDLLQKAPTALSAMEKSPFVHGQQGQLWKLPMFDDASTILSCAPFELITSVVQYAGFSDTGDVNTASSMRMGPAKDRRWFVSLCLRFIELSMNDDVESTARRTYLPFAATCLATLISEGEITSNVSTFELDGLTRFAITEDSEPLRFVYDPDKVEVGGKMGSNSFYKSLWAEIITPNDYMKGMHRGLTLRILQGRGAFLNRFSDAQYEREQLQCFMNQSCKSCIDTGISPQRNSLGGSAFDAIKSYLEELMFQLKYEDGNASDEEGGLGLQEKESAVKGGGSDKPLQLPQMTGCLSLLLTVLLSKHSTAEDISKHVCDIFEGTFGSAFDLLVENMPSLKSHPLDLFIVFNHLHGIVRVLTFIAAFGGGKIPHLFGNQAKSLFSVCKKLLKENRNEMCTSGMSNQAAVSMSRRGFDSDSDEDNFVSSRAQIQPTQPPRSRFSDDSDDGLMDDDDDSENNHRSRSQKAPPIKRRRMGNGSKSKARKDSSRDNASTDTAIDSKGAWACSSFLLVLQPSFQSADIISSHLVWPEDYNKNVGYGIVSKTPDPCSAIVCASLFCQKSVILRRDRLDLQCERDEDQESPLILSIEALLQARRRLLPSSKYFMCSLGLVAAMVKIAEYGESSEPITEDESKIVLEALYPEGVGKENDDYYMLRQMKRHLKFRVSYLSHKLHESTKTFIYALGNLRKEFESVYGSKFILPSFCHIDENVRSLACDVLGAALYVFPEQGALVADVLKQALPKLDNKNKFDKWVDKNMSDPRLIDDQKDLEDRTLNDIEISIEYHTIECIGLIAGYAKESALAKDMIWKLIDLASKKPLLLLPCYRSCKQAAFIREYKSLSGMFDDMMPHLLVRWLESQRSLRDFPLLLMSPFALDRACRFLPLDIMSMLLSEGGWSDEFFNLDSESESQTLNERVLTSFVESVSKFLIPNILLSSSEAPANDIDNDCIDASTYLTECVIILKDVDSDNNKAHMLIDHISDLYGYVAVLAENGDATLECENAFKLLKRCVSSGVIERQGAKGAFLVLRHILLLHLRGIAVVGLDGIELTSSSFIDGMKYVAKQLKTSSSKKHVSFLEQLGSSMTESIVLVKYWLSSSQTSRQREEAWGTFSLLCGILADNIKSGKVGSGELGFALNSFIAVLLDPQNTQICPIVLESLNMVLSSLFANTAKETLVEGSISVLHKLSLTLLQTHQRAYEKLYTSCGSALCRLEYEQKSSQGLLSGFEGTQKTWDSLGEAPWVDTSLNRDAILKHLVASKASLEERVSSDIMLGAYECLEIIATSGKMQLEDILGAEDIVLQCSHKESVFKSVNEKYSMLTFFNSIQQNSTKNSDETNLDVECEHFIRIMKEHPISTISDEFDSGASSSSHAVLARLLALRRLERVLLQQQRTVTTIGKIHEDVYHFLLSICHSREPETSRVISSRCLGEMKLDNLTTRHEQDIHNLNGMDETLNDPILSIKRSILTLLGQYLLSECADTSLVAMKTAKALLVTPTGKEVWQSLDGDNDVKSLLRPFNTHDDGKLRKEAVKVSKSCLERLKSAGGVTSSENSNSWCWQDELWTCLGSEESLCDLWIRNITSSIISCCFGKESKVEKGDQEFFRICQGLCAKEASFAASIFPALIFHLLDSEARDACREDSGVPDIIMSNTAIGSPTSGMNKVISHCFSRIIGSNVQVAPQVITVVLNTLELLRSITEHRFLTSTDHRKNTSHIADAFTNSASLSKKSVSKKRKSRDNSVSDAANIIDSIVENSPKWRGFPYGVVLRVSGLDVAKACVKVKRYYSALYYAEMSMNNLIGTGAFFEDLADSQLKHSESAVLDISGFGVLSTEEGPQADDKVLEKALVAKDIIASCLSELHSQDELQGVLSQGSALNLKRNITSLATLEGCRRDKPLSMLLDIDNELQTSSASISESVSAHTHASLGLSTVASCLEELGLNHVKHNYLAGVENHLGRDNRSGRHYLREKWFEDSLNKTLQWDDTLLPRMNMTDDGALLTQHHVTPQNLSVEATVQDAPPPSSQPMATFYESVYESLLSFARNDATGGLGHVLQARKSVLADMEYLAGSEAQSTGMVNHLTKLNSLGRLELVAKTIEGKSDLSFLLNRWGFSREGSAETLESILLNDDVNFDVKDQVVDIEGEAFRSIRTGLSVEELSLKLLTNKFSSSHEGIAMALSSHIYKSCSIYRELGRPDAAKISLSSLRSLVQVFQSAGVADHSSGKLPLMLRMEDAKIMKSQDDLDGAIMHCKMIANHLTNSSDSSVDIERDQICAESLLLGGLWMRENNVDSSEIILSSYLEAAAGLAMKVQKKEPSTANIHRASMSSFKLGEFSATLYNSVDARTSSDGWKRRIIAALERKKELKVIEAQMAKLTRNKEAHHDALILHSTLSKEVLMDDRELQSVENSIQRYLHLAVESYCNALKLCPTSVTDVSKYVFQLVSLWFKNCQQKETKDIVNHLLKSNLSQIPSYRLVPLTYQLFSRIDEVQDDDSNGGFQNTLRDIVLEICSEHPYHGIVQILALSNGQRIGGGVNGRHADAYLENIGTTKVDAVNKIIKELRKQAPAYVSALIDSYQTLMISYMNLAEFVTKSIEKNLKNHPFKKHKLDLDSCLSGGGRRGKKNVTGSSENMPAIITQPPPIRPDAKYGNGTEDPIGTERVVSFEPTFDLTPTGIHRPKIIKCIGSKGTRFKQLVKGEDDMRQDAIMQQVFGTVNDLLRHEGNDFIKKSLGSSVGSTRRLRLITYGITPLSPTSGVLEWVENTMCFGDYLTDKSRKLGAKSKYYPGEWGLSDIRDFYKAQDTPETKRLAFDKICDNSSPAFRFFFLEYFKSSMEAWHTARTLYTRSCAVNSIVGHILGIGDRHTSNILVHTKTGEVVHIDFGIVFEQGKTLTTPELVPFRLTRDIVDGMGPSGTDGVFSKSAEATMGVLRNNADTLLTILSAVVSDPLYKWSLSPMKAKQHQRKDDDDDEDGNGSTTIVSMPNAWMASTSDDRNDTADRAIAKIHEKLQGYEDGISGEHKTVAGQVKLLINEARDPDNLCMMFCGWAPWM